MNTMMNRIAGVATLALAALPLTAVPFVAHAQDRDYRVQVGDLTQPAQARAFNQSIDQVADRLCGDGSADLASRRAEAQCRAAVHADATSQLTSAQRIDLAQTGSASSAMGRTGQ